MALPFFRKSKDKGKPAPEPKPQAAPAAEAPHRFDADAAPEAGGIVVEETLGAPQTAVDEAAIQFAAGQVHEAERTLKTLIDKGETRAWAMLFDLYWASGREADFEQLSVDYAVRFETSPPVWRPPVGVPATAVDEDSIALPGMLSRAAADELTAALAASPAGAAISVDLSRIELVDEAGAEAAGHQLEQAIQAGRSLRLIGAERLIALLTDLTRAIHSKKAHWQLLLTLYQLLGRMEAFEDTAVDFAVHFEVSPPSWVEMATAESVEATPTAPANGLSGEITPTNDQALKARIDAAPPGEVRIDLSHVTRIDYGSVTQLIGVVMEGLGQGKSVTFAGHHALIHELFRVMGIDQLAQLEPRPGV